MPYPPFLVPTACHELLTAAGAAEALTTATVRGIRCAVAREDAAAGGGGPAGVAAAHETSPEGLADSNALAALATAVTSCRCADAIVAPLLLAALPAVCGGRGGQQWTAAGGSRQDFLHVAELVWGRLMGAGAAGLTEMPFSGDVIFNPCGEQPAYAAAAAWAAALSDDPAVLRFLVGRLEEGVGPEDDRRYSARMFYRRKSLLLPLCFLVPRRLLDVAPDIMDVLVRKARWLASPQFHTAGFEVGISILYVLVLLRVLGAVDPPRLRRTAGLPHCLAAAYATLVAPPSACALAAPAALVTIRLLVLATPAAAAFAASPPALRLLVTLADGGTSIAFDAATLALHVATAGGTGGAAAAAIAPLRAARRTWRRLAAAATLPHDAAVTAALLRLSDGDGGSVGQQPPPAGAAALPPWAPRPFPPRVLFSLNNVFPPRRCWGCGTQTRAGRHAGRPLPHCSGCAVAYYCSPPCAKASWAGRGGREPHKRTCRGWAAYATAIDSHSFTTDVHGVSCAPLCGRKGVYAPGVENLTGHPREWMWLLSVCRAVRQAGLPFTAVAVVVDVPMGLAQVLPAPECAAAPDAVPAIRYAPPPSGAPTPPTLRIVYAEHPPRVAEVALSSLLRRSGGGGERRGGGGGGERRGGGGGGEQRAGAAVV